MKIVFILLVLSTTLLFATDKSVADDYFNALKTENYKHAFDISTKALQDALPEAKLQEIWESLPVQMGKYEELIKVETVEQKEMVTYIYSLSFEKSVLDMKITVDNDKLVTGLFFTPSSVPKPGEENKLPNYIAPDNIEEEKISFNCDGYDINGKIVTPKGVKEFPIVLMLTGSGPNDMDETIYQRKPFRDIAYGLGNKGIATLRWSKRTRDYPNIVDDKPQFNIENEYAEEVTAALSFIKTKYPKAKLYLLGHSLGATVIPAIANSTNDFEGYLMLAGTAFKLEDVVLDQYKRIFAMDGLDDKEKEIIEETKRQVKEVKALTEETKVSSPLLLGVSKPYWLSMNRYNQVDEFKKMTKPVLVLQGEKDYQVLMDDYEAWEEAADERKNFTFKSYPFLDHLFMLCTGESTPDSYLEKKYVSKTLINDIAEWIISIQ